MEQTATEFLKSNNVELVSHYDADIAEHIARHSDSSLTIGSQFNLSPDDAETALDIGQKRLAEELKAVLLTTGKVGRVEFAEHWADPVGRDALIDLSKVSPENVFELVRDAGDARAETRIKVVLAQPDEIPLAHDITFIGGPYGPTGKAGFYTAFPGDPGQPFSNTEYWQTHGFLATPDQVRATIDEMLAKADEVAPSVATKAQIATMAEAAETRLSTFGPAPVQVQTGPSLSDSLWNHDVEGVSDYSDPGDPGFAKFDFSFVSPKGMKEEAIIEGFQQRLEAKFTAHGLAPAWASHEFTGDDSSPGSYRVTLSIPDATEASLAATAIAVITELGKEGTAPADADADPRVGNSATQPPRQAAKIRASA